MSELKFTPGPWKTLAGDWDKSLHGYCRYTIKPLKEINIADANLIAAAPDLYAALKLCITQLADCMLFPEREDEQLAYSLATQAIAKAEGRS